MLVAIWEAMYSSTSWGTSPVFSWATFLRRIAMRVSRSGGCTSVIRPISNLERMRFSKPPSRSEEHTSELQSRFDIVCRLLLEKKKIFKLNDTLQQILINSLRIE